MNAILAIIADGRQAIFDIDIWAGRNTLFSHLLYNFMLKPLMATLSDPLRRGSRGCGMSVHQNHATRWENSSSWWGCVCDVCFASKKSFERELFVPAGTHF
jgi:hypothetical protein